MYTISPSEELSTPGMLGVIEFGKKMETGPVAILPKIVVEGVI
jgi:hypothetical protein